MELHKDNVFTLNSETLPCSRQNMWPMLSIIFFFFSTGVWMHCNMEYYPCPLFKQDVPPLPDHGVDRRRSPIPLHSLERKGMQNEKSGRTIPPHGRSESGNEADCQMGTWRSSLNFKSSRHLLHIGRSKAHPSTRCLHKWNVSKSHHTTRCI